MRLDRLALMDELYSRSSRSRGFMTSGGRRTFALLWCAIFVNLTVASPAGQGRDIARPNRDRQGGEPMEASRHLFQARSTAGPPSSVVQCSSASLTYTSVTDISVAATSWRSA